MIWDHRKMSHFHISLHIESQYSCKQIEKGDARLLSVQFLIAGFKADQTSSRICIRNSQFEVMADSYMLMRGCAPDSLDSEYSLRSEGLKGLKRLSQGTGGVPVSGLCFHCGPNTSSGSALSLSGGAGSFLR